MDRHALAAVDLLHFSNQMLLHLADAQNTQDIVGVRGALGELLTNLYMVTIADQKTHSLGNGMLFRIRSVIWGDDDLAGLVGVFDLDSTSRLADWRTPLGHPSLEELDHTRETLRDVIG